MSRLTKSARQVWKSVQLYVGFHRDPAGRKRDTAKVWPPKNANASIGQDPDERETFLVVKTAARKEPRDIQVKLRPDKIVLRRDEGPAWQGVIIGDYTIDIQVNGRWVHVCADGSVRQEIGDDITWIEADGAVLNKTEFAEATMSGDGENLARRTQSNVSAISSDGVVSRQRRKDER